MLLTREAAHPQNYACRPALSGPVLFRQDRVGFDGGVFDMLKFQTMRVDPNAVENDIKNWSPWLDLKILLLTPGAVLGGRGAE